ncbi:Rnase Y domain-containing protein, partial [Bifidobacterium pullorum]|uniref:Rnase Y domain-containing protein n=1 Tax=Bifidobacterium pullorum TaxID=78448 RepID=UPI0030B94D40
MAVVLVIAAAVISHFVTVSNLKKNAESKIGSAETKAREIIDDAVKTAEAKKKESLLEIKEESIRTKNELE